MLSLKTEFDLLKETAITIRARRLQLNWTQDDVAARSGVPIGTLRRFEQTGRAPFLTVAKILTTLGLTDHFLNALGKPAASAPTINAFLAQNSSLGARRRARRSRSRR